MIRGKVGGGSGGGLIEVWADDYRTGIPDVDEEVVVEAVSEHDRNCVPQRVLNDAYRERAQVVAALFAMCNWETCRVEAPDDPMWWIVYAETPQGQVSWHVSERDIDLFRSTPIRKTWSWDGHTTAEKYERLARLEPKDCA